jgi:putative hydrolase of the HAD superfamily
MDMKNARRIIVRMAMDELHFSGEKKARLLADDYSRRQYEYVCLFDDTIPTLEKIKDDGIRMALVTNGTAADQRDKINRFGLSKYFEFCLIEEETGFGKPDVRVFHLALDKLKLNPEDVWMVGDNLVWDIECPKKAGIFSIWKDFKRKGLPEGSAVVPDFIISSISELPL